MRTNHPKRSTVLFVLPLVVGCAVAAWSLSGPRAVRAASGTSLVAGSVCEAQELKYRKERDPSLEIEIPKEYDKQFPTLEACRSHDAAGDPDSLLR